MKRMFILVLFSVMILMINAQTYQEIGNGATSSNLPVFALWNYAWSSSLYPASGFGGARTITQLAFNHINAATTTMANQKIYLKETSASTFAGNGYEDPVNNGYTLVYNGSVSIVPGWVIIDITDFNYTGNGNLIVHWENRSGISNYTTNWYSTDCGAGVVKCSGSDTAFPTTTGTPPYPVALPNLRFYYTSDNPATPYNPTPANNATGVSITSPLSFSVGSNTTGYQIWTGNSEQSLTQIYQSSLITPGTYQYTPASNWAPNTQYFWKIIATNGTGSTSSSIWNFTTETVITSLPVSQGFETNFPLQGWLNPGDLWTQATYPHTGSYCAKASYLHTGTAILQTPRIVLPASPARLKFFWADADYFPERIIGHDTTYCEISNNSGQSWTTLAYLAAASQQSAYQEMNISLASYASQNVNIRFRDVTDGSLAAYGTFLDDILIEVIPSTASIQINPSSLDFSTTVVGGILTQTVNISNQGSTPLIITGVSTSGAFSATNPGTINAGQSASSVVTFNPTGAGATTGTLTYNISGDFAGNNTLQCSGNAYAPLTELFQNFDAATTMPQNWSTIVVGQSASTFVNVYTSSFDAHSGTRFIKMYNAGDDTLNAKLYLITPGLTTLSAHSLSFYAKSSWGLPTDTMILGTITNPMDSNTFTPLQTVTLTDEYQQISYTFSPTINDKFIAFKHGLGGGENYAVYLDDISWESDNNTPNPAVAVNPTNAMANVRLNYINKHLNLPLSWSSGGGNPTGYRLFFGTTQGFEIINNQDIGNVNTFALNSALNYNTLYYWKIVPYNEQGNAINCPVWTFTIQADPTLQITSAVSLTEGFEQSEIGTIPLGWEMENLNSDSSIWSTIGNSTSSINSHTGIKAMHINFSFLTPHDDWLYTPPLGLIAGRTYKLEFWYKTIPFPGDPCVEKMEVKWGALPSSIAMSGQLFFNDNITNDSYIHYESTFTPSLDGEYFVGFHEFSDPIQFVLLIDDVKVSQTGTANDEELVPNVSDFLTALYPNPFSVDTAITYQVKSDKVVKLEIYNTKGQKVRTLNNGLMSKGKHNLKWDGRDENGNIMGSGVYFCRMQTNSYKSVLKMVKLY